MTTDEDLYYQALSDQYKDAVADIPEEAKLETLPDMDASDLKDTLTQLSTLRDTLPPAHAADDMQEDLDKNIGMGFLSPGMYWNAVKNIGKSVSPWHSSTMSERQRYNWGPGGFGPGDYAGTNLREKQIKDLTSLIIERIPSDVVVSPEMVQGGLRDIVTAALNGPEYLKNLPEEHIMWEAPGKIDPRALNVLNTYAMDSLSWDAPDAETLTAEFAARWNTRDIIAQKMIKILADSEARGDVSGTKYGIIFGEDPKESVITEGVPNFNREISKQLAPSLSDRTYQALLLADLDPNKLAVAIQSLAQPRSAEHVGLLYSEGNDAEHFIGLQNAFAPVRDAVPGEIYIPFFQSPDGQLGVNLSAIEEGLYSALFDTIAINQGFNLGKVGTKGAIPTHAAHEDIKKRARNRARMEVATYRGQSDDLIFHKDPFEAQRKYEARESFKGKVAGYIENYVNLGWTLINLDKAQHLPLMIQVNSMIRNGQEEEAKALLEGKLSRREGRSLVWNTLAPIGEAIAALEKNEKTYSPYAGFTRAWLANILLPSKITAGVLFKDGEPYKSIRDEGFFEGIITDATFLDSIGFGRALDALIRMAPSESVATSYAMASDKWRRKQLGDSIKDFERAKWFTREMTMNMGTPAMIDRQLRQEVDQGRLSLEFGDAFYDWIPGGDIVVFPKQTPRSKDVTIQGVLGSGTMGLIWAYEPDGLLGGANYIYTAGSLGQMAKMKVGRRATMGGQAGKMDEMFEFWDADAGRMKRDKMGPRDRATAEAADEAAAGGRRTADIVEPFIARPSTYVPIRIGDPTIPRPLEPFGQGVGRPRIVNNPDELARALGRALTEPLETTGRPALTMEDMEAYLVPFMRLADEDPTGTLNLVMANAKVKTMAELGLRSDTEIATFMQNVREDLNVLGPRIEAKLKEAREQAVLKDEAIEEQARLEATLKFIRKTTDYHTALVQEAKAELEAAQKIRDKRAKALEQAKERTSLFRLSYAATRHSSASADKWNSYRISMKEDRRFVDKVAKLKDGRTIEKAYIQAIDEWKPSATQQLVARAAGYSEATIFTPRATDHIRIYRDLWTEWAEANKAKMQILADRSAKNQHQLWAEDTPVHVAKARATPTEISVVKVISGGQTGVDRIGLEVAKAAGIETGGMAPKGYRTDTGPDRALRGFGLEEHPETSYMPRTRANVDNSDATVLFGDMSSVGSRATIDYLKKTNKRYIINPDADKLRKWLIDKDVKVLNVAGNRAKKLGDKADEVREVLTAALQKRRIDLSADRPPKLNAATELALLLNTGRYNPVSSSEASIALTKILDNPVLLAEAIEVFRGHLPVDDFLSANGDLLKSLGFSLDDEGVRKFYAEALVRLATEPAGDASYRALEEANARFDASVDVLSAAKNRYVSVTGQFRKALLTDLFGGERKGVTKALIDKTWPQTQGAPNVRAAMIEVHTTVKDILAERQLWLQVIKMGEAFIGKPRLTPPTAEEKVARLKLTKAVYAHAGGGLAGIKAVEALPPWITEKGYLDRDIESKKLAGLAVATLLKHLDRNIVALRAYSMMTDETIETLRQAYLMKGKAGIVTGGKEAKEAMAEWEGHLAKQMPRQVMAPTTGYKGSTDPKMQRADPVDMYFTARHLTTIWSSPQQPFHNMSKGMVEGFLNTFKGRAAWLSWGTIELKRLQEAFPMFTRFPRHAPARVHPEIDRAIQQQHRRINGIFTGLDLIYFHKLRGDRQSLKAAENSALQFLSFSGPGVYNLESAFTKLPIFGMKIPAAAIPFLSDSSIPLQFVSGLPYSILHYGFRGIDSDLQVRQAQAPRREAGLHTDITEDNLLIDAIIRAYVQDNKGVRGLNTVQREGISQVRDHIMGNFNSSKLYAKGYSDIEVYQKLKAEVRAGLEKTVDKETNTRIFRAVPAGSMQEKRSDLMFIKALVGSAGQQLLAEELWSTLGIRVTESNADLMNRINVGYDSSAIDELNAARMSRPVAVGDWVIPSEQAEILSYLVRSGGVTYTPEHAVGGRVTSPDLETARASKDKPSEGGLWLFDEILYKQDTPEGKETWKAMARLPVFETVVRENLGSMGRQVLKIDKNKQMYMLDDDKWYPMSQHSRRDIHFSIFDAYDGMARWAFEAFAQPGRVGSGVVAEIGRQIKIARNEQMAMVLHSIQGGGHAMLPKPVMEGHSRRLQRNTKDLRNFYSELRDEGVLPRMAQTAPVQIYTMGNNLWKYQILFGSLALKYSYLAPQHFTDTMQIFSYQGPKAAAKIGMMAGLGFVPYIGKWAQTKVLEQMRLKGGAPHGTLSATWDPRWADLFEATNKVVMVRDGKNYTAADMMQEAAMVGSWDYMLRQDIDESVRRQVRKIIAKDPNWWNNLQLHAKEFGGFDAIKGAHVQFQMAIARAQGNMRAITYWYYRIELGMTKDEAAKTLNKTLIDWDNSVSDIEKTLFSHFFLFYTLHKNGFIQGFDIFTEMHTTAGRNAKKRALNYGAKYLTMGTRVQRLRLLSRFMSMPQDYEEINPDEPLDEEEMMQRALRTQVGRYMRDRPIWGYPEGLSAEEQAAWLEKEGRTASTKLTYAPPITALEYTAHSIEFVQLVTATAILFGNIHVDPEGHVIPLAVNPERLSKARVDWISQYMMPIPEMLFSAGMSELELRPAHKARWGHRGRAGEKTLIDAMTYYGFSPGVSETRDEVTGELRYEYNWGMFSWPAKEILFPAAAAEMRRIQDMATVIFGKEVFGHDITSGKIATLSASGGDNKARWEALKELYGIGRQSIITPETYLQYQLYEKTRRSEKRTKDLQKERDTKLWELQQKYGRHLTAEDIEMFDGDEQ